MDASSIKDGIIKFVLSALIAGFFLIFLTGSRLQDCKIYPHKPIAPILLVFFR
jgi:hypothetical protein